MKMKKMMLGLAAAAVVICMASCSKSCHCTVENPAGSVESEMTIEDLQSAYPDREIKKCSDANFRVEVLDMVSSVECK